MKHRQLLRLSRGVFQRSSCRFAHRVRPASSHPIVRSPLPGWRGADLIDLMAGRSQGGSMHRKLIALAAAVSMALLVSGVAAASITLFEPPLFHLASVNGQSGVGGFPWKSAPLGAIPSCNPIPTLGQYDQAVVANTVAPTGEPPGFGSQSLRMSNACASGEFFYQTYSPHGATSRSARRGPIRCSSPSSRLCPRRPPTSPDCS